MWIPEKRKYNLHGMSMHFLGMVKLQPKILLISVFKIQKKTGLCRKGGGMGWGRGEERKLSSLSLGFIPTFVIGILFHKTPKN